MFNADYMNGFNDAIELVLNNISETISSEKNGDVSINDQLRMLRHEVLKRAFFEIKSKQEN